MRPITGLVLGSLLIPIGLATAIFWVPAAITDAIEYSQAAACPEPGMPSSASTCWAEAQAVVQSTEVHYHRRHSDWVVNVSDDFGRQRVTVWHRDVFHQLGAGNQVTARFWKGKVVLLRIPGAAEDLPSDDEPGTQVGTAMLVTVFVLLAGAFFFLGALGVHRRLGSWSRSVDKGEWGEDIYALPVFSGPAKPWIQAGALMVFLTMIGAFLCWAWFGVPMLTGALIGAGFGAFSWAWAIHHRARTLGRT